MSKQLHFVSGMPRACSTLLCNVLAQNPAIHATGTSPLHEIGYFARQVFNTEEAKTMDQEHVLEPMFYDYVKHGCLNAFNSVTDRPVVIDKCRSWVGHLDQLFKVFPDAKVLVPVRDIRGVLSSMEKKYRKHPQVFNGVERANPQDWTTIDKRVSGWLKTPPISIAIERVHEAKVRFGDKIHFVHAEALTENPTAVMNGVWDYLGMERYTHDFNGVEQYTTEHDTGFPYGDHSIRKAIKPLAKDYEEIFNPQLSAALDKQFNWINTL